MKIQDLAKEYFKYFKSKDIDRLKVLFDQKINDLDDKKTMIKIY